MPDPERQRWLRRLRESAQQGEQRDPFGRRQATAREIKEIINRPATEEAYLPTEADIAEKGDD